jgi:hypothetical protein
MKRVLIISAAIMLTVSPSAQARPVEDVQLWNIINVGGKIKGDIVFAGDVQGRLTNNLGRYSQTLARGAIGVKISPKVTLYAGYTYTEIERPNARNSVEHRPHQQISWTIGAALGGTLTSRTRLEERWFRGSQDVGFRLRQQLRLTVPFKKDDVAVFAASEVLFHLNSTDWGARAGFDQLRTSIGLSLPLNKSVAVEAAYQPIYIKGNVVDRLNHTIPVTLVVKF